MKRIFYLPGIILLIFNLQISCNKDDNLSHSWSSAYFPDSVGTRWVYNVYDSLTSTSSLVTVTITGDTVVSGIDYKIWKYQSPLDVMYKYCTKSGDSIKFVNLQIGAFVPLYFIDQLYVIPFEPGHGWLNKNYLHDTSYVDGILNIHINNTIYQDIALIIRSGGGFNEYLYEKIWFIPHLGMVRLERNHIILGPYKNEVWTLVETNL